MVSKVVFLIGVTSLSAPPMEGALSIPILENFNSWICSSTYGWFLYLSEIYFYKGEKSMAYDRIRTCILSVGVSDSDPLLYDLREAIYKLTTLLAKILFLKKKF